ncbi:TPA: ATP-dependent DNA ligase [Candidatus Bathyarchaeota archaeon]|nr:ATP-dependent DNA ligase [Candidatus Bathyarchaeota archaeon]
MLYDALVETYVKLEATTKRLEMTDILAELLKAAEPEEMAEVIYLTQGKIHPDWTGEPEIGMAEKSVVEAIMKATGLPKAKVEQLVAETGDIGHAAEAALRQKKVASFAGRQPTASEVYNTLDAIANESGQGSAGRKVDRLVKLMVNVSPTAARYLARTVVGALRLGVGDMTILDALSIARTGSKAAREALERAYYLSSDLGDVAETLAGEGLGAIENFEITVGKPIMAMAAQRLSTADEIVEKLGHLSAEYKLDGERLQIHKDGDKVQIFSRRLENITHMYPDAVKMALRQIRVGSAIVEGEVVAVDVDTGEMRPFQTLMQRRRKHGIQEAMERLPITIFLFDCLYADGEDYTPQPYPKRKAKLEEIIEESTNFHRVNSIETEDPRELERYFEQAIADGTEGLVCKSLADESVYRAGARSWLWVKLKRSYQSKMSDPVDLVVVGAFYGMGRRAGSYGALLGASYDREADVYRTVCKVGSGFTDEVLAKLPKDLESLRHDGKHPRVDSLLKADIWFTPERVMEVLGDELTLSPIHTAGFDAIRKDAGLAVRFPRFQRWREDKSAEEATTIPELLDMYRSQLKQIAKGNEG